MDGVRARARRRRRHRALGVAGGGRGHALRGLRVHGGGGSGARAGRPAGRGQRGEPPRARGLVGRGRAALALVRGFGGRRLPAAAGGRRVRRHAAPSRSPAGAVALAGRGLLHDAGHDVRLPGLHRRARRHHARRPAAAALGLLGADAAGPAVLVRAVLPQRAARPAAAPRRHGPAGGTGHRHRVRGEHGGHLRPGRPARPRGLFRFAHHVRLLPAHRALAGGAAARAHRRRAGGADEPAARQRRAPGGRRRLRARRRAAAGAR